MKNLLRRTILVASAVFALACADAAPSGGSNGGGNGNGNGTNADMGTSKPGADRGVPNGTRRLMIVGMQELFALTGNELNLQVAYEAGRRPIEGERVSFRMLDENGSPAGAAGVDGSLLNSGSATTNRDGVSSVRVRLGQVESFFQIEASAPGAQSVRWRITVGNAGVGAFSVRLIYQAMTGRYTYRDFTHAEVFLFGSASRQNCDTIAQNAGAIFGADLSARRDPFNEVDNRVNINSLQAGAVYSVAAVAYAQNGSVAAFGCLDGQTVTGGMATPFDLALQDLPLEFKGRFRVVQTFNLRTALESSRNGSLETVNEMFDILQILGGQGPDRVDAVERLLCDLIDLEGGVCRAVSLLVTNSAIGPILDVIGQESPQLFAVLRAMADVVKILEEMTIVGEMEFVDSHPDQEGWLRNSENRWKKFRFEWREGCPPGAACQNEFTIGDVHSDPNGRESAIFAPFDSIVRGSSLEIKEHVLTVKYGLLLLGIAEYWVIPATLGVNGPVSIGEMLQELLPCEAINERLGDPNFCEMVLAAGLSEVLREVIGQLSFADDSFTLRGTVNPVDTDGDLVIDTLESGVWQGRIGGDAEFPGCFSGCRGLECEPRPCLPPQ